MYERFSVHARKVMQLANQEAQRFNHEHIGTEHILLGLVKEDASTAANVLKNFSVDPRKIRLEVEKIIQPGPDMITMGKLPQTPRAKKVIEYAIEEARTLDHNYVGSEHVLLGVIREGEGVGAQVLRNFGLTLEKARAEVVGLTGNRLRAAQRPPELELTALPPATREIVIHFNAILQKGNEMKEEAIAAHDFEGAALLRDQLVKVQTIKEWFIRRQHRPCGHGPGAIPS